MRAFVLATLLLLTSTANAQVTRPTPAPASSTHAPLPENAPHGHSRSMQERAVKDRQAPAFESLVVPRIAPGWFLAGSTPDLYEVSKTQARAEPECGNSILRSR